jgi:hypothetical protein
MKTAVIGTRTFENYEQLEKTLNDLGDKPTEIISGGAKGADALAERYATENGIKMTVINADWHMHGKMAGPMRNLLIVEACEQLVAMWDGESKGTKHAINEARKQGKPTKVVNYASEQTGLFG